MKTPPLFVVLFFCLHCINAQNLNWQWGELQRSKGQLISILSDEKDQFSSIHSNTQLGGSSYLLTQYIALNAQSDMRIKPVSPQGFGYYVETLRFKQRHLIFIADRNGKEMKLFVKVMDDEQNVLEELELLTYIDQGPNALPNFYLLEAPNKDYFVVFYQIPGKRNGTDTFGYQIYDQELKTHGGGEHSLPYDANLSSIEDYFLTNNGEFFIGVLELMAVENHGVRVGKTFKNMHVYQFNKEGMKDFTFDLQNKRISNFILNAQNTNRLTLFGIYSNSEWNGMQDGFFSVQLNLETDSALAVGFLPFSREIMLSELTDAEQMRVIKRQERNNEEPQLSRYEVRDIFTLKDGSYVGSLEKYYVYTSTNFNNQTGQRMTTNYFYYNDIVAFCIDTTGKLRWEQRIPKMQVSVNDYGPFSSFASFIDGEKLHFIFNDSKANYDAAGAFNSRVEDIAAFSLSKQRNVGAWVQIDLKDGHMQRQIIHERSDENILLVPKSFQRDAFKNGIYTYGVYGPQEKFGYIHLQTAP